MLPSTTETSLPLLADSRFSILTCINCGFYAPVISDFTHVQLYIFYPLCCIILSHKLHPSTSAGFQRIYKRPLPKSGGKNRSEGRRYTHRLVPHLGVQGRSSSSSCWIREGCMREAWSQLSGVQRVRSPGIRRCWDECCPCQII